jgi:AmmeMemoRadiSam system protein A
MDGMVAEGRGATLLKLARSAIDAALGGPAVPRPTLARLEEPGACFVSLKQGEALRGCIGNLKPLPTLYSAVVHNAEAAAFHDPRFSPLRREELARTRIEISLMSPLEPIGASTREELLANLRAGVDGLVLTAGPCSAVFIPAMWEQIPDKDAFVDHLLVKGRFPRGRWPAGMRAERFTAEHFVEEEGT